MTGRAQFSSATRSIANPAAVSALAPSRTMRTLQRQANGAQAYEGATAMVQEVLSTPGRPLDRTTRSQLEPRLGYDFSSVRVHDDSPAARSAGAIGANAYTAGNHIVFGRGRYAPQTPRGQSLLAHELTHVAQQAEGPVGGTPIGDGFAVSSPGDAFERHASANAFVIPAQHDGDLQRLPRGSGPPRTLQRDTAGDIGAVAGVAGAVLGAAALVFAILAWRRPANPAPTTGGITLNTQPISASDSNGVPANRQDAAVSAPTRTEKILDMKTDGKNFTDINMDVSTDGVSIFSAAPQTVPHGYNGGTGGSSAVLNFGSPSTIAVPKYDTTEPAKPEAAKAKTPPKQGGKGKPDTPVPLPPPAPKDTAGVVQVPFNGTNSVGEKESLQQFAGKLVIRANPGTSHRAVECVECAPRNQVGFAYADGQKIGHVDYEGHAGGAVTQGATPTPAPQQAQPSPPPPTGR